MHDPFPSIWADRIANLPPVKSLGFVIEPNRDAEELSCLICENCRGRHTRWQEARDKRALEEADVSSR